MVIMWGLTALAACRPWVDDWRTKEQNRLNSLYITSYHHARVLVWTHKPSLYIRLHACSYSERPNPLYRDITLSELIDWLIEKQNKQDWSHEWEWKTTTTKCMRLLYCQWGRKSHTYIRGKNKIRLTYPKIQHSLPCPLPLQLLKYSLLNTVHPPV